MTHDIKVDEGQRQLVVLALTLLSRSRVGWEAAIVELVKTIPGGRDLYDAFRKIHEYAPKPYAIVASLRSNETNARIVGFDMAVVIQAWSAVAGPEDTLIEIAFQDAREFQNLKGTDFAERLDPDQRRINLTVEGRELLADVTPKDDAERKLWKRWSEGMVSDQELVDNPRAGDWSWWPLDRIQAWEENTIGRWNG